MTTTRKAIRNKIVEILTGATTAGANVFASRAKKLFENQLPALLVYSSNENISIFNESPREYQRVLSVKIEIAAQGGDELDDTLDDIAQQIEATLSEHQTLGELVGDVVLTSAELSIVENGETSSGGCLLTYDVTYYTLDVASGLVEPNVLEDFITAGIDYKVVPSEGEPPAAGDVVSLEQ